MNGLTDMDAKIVKTLEKELAFAEDFIGLVETTGEKALDVQLAAIKVLTERNEPIILLSTSRSYPNLLALLEKNRLDTDKMFIFDLASRGQPAREVTGKNVICFDGANELTKLSIEITKRIGRKESCKFVFLDSITTMLVHNKPEDMVKFIYWLFMKMRLNRVNGLLISSEKGGNEVVGEIAQVCDRIIRI